MTIKSFCIATLCVVLATPSIAKPEIWWVIRSNTTHQCTVVKDHPGDLGGQGVARQASKAEAEAAMAKMQAPGQPCDGQH